MSDADDLMPDAAAIRADRALAGAMHNLLAGEARQLLTEAAQPAVVDAVLAETRAALDSDPDTAGDRPAVLLVALRALRVVVYPPRGVRAADHPLGVREAAAIVAEALVQHAWRFRRRNDPTDPRQLLLAAAQPDSSA